MAAPTVSREWLDWVGELAKGSASASARRPDPDRFTCFLEEQPATLVPRHFWTEPAGGYGKAAGENDLIWNPECHFCGPGEIPAEVASDDGWRDGFVFGKYSTAWVHDSGRKQWRPFWLGADLAARCRIAQYSGLTLGSFTAAEMELLLAAGLLTSPSREQVASRRWQTTAQRGAAYFQQNRYYEVAGLLHPFHVGEMRRYYRRLIRRGRVALGDYQSERRYVAHNEPVARFFHLQLAGVVEQLVGQPVKPSYVYFASYQSGAKLKRHADREQCEFSLTFCLDYSPEPDKATPWPLHLETSRGPVAVEQALGDALLYRGRELPHWRNRLPDGHVSTSIFFHYVPADFSGTLS